MLATLLSLACLGWSITVVVVCTIGYIQICRYYRNAPPRAVCETVLPLSEVPHVTVIRPVKGLEPCLYECLASTFFQTYPKDRITIYFCVADQHDAALPTLHWLIRDFAGFDVHILIQGEDISSTDLGPNPKIRNMSRAYREAKGDIIWIIDCNVWVAKGVLGRMVDKLCGLGHDGPTTPYKFVHQLPLVVDITDKLPPMSRDETNLGLRKSSAASTSTASTQTISTTDVDSEGLVKHWFKSGGGKLEEVFLASSHAKFYTAINTVLVAPCIVGKSNMFRKSHLDELTAAQSKTMVLPKPTSGLDFFSSNICEDHLIGDMLWKKRLKSEGDDKQRGKVQWGKHAMLFGDFAVQPMANMSIPEYCARRVRWLRVRKFTVTVATLVEPGTESFLCSAYASWAVTSLPVFKPGGIFGTGISSTWTSFVVCWFVMVLSWLAVDWTLYRILHTMASTELDENTPSFAHPRKAHSMLRPYKSWVPSWLAREALALPIWISAVYGGTNVTWRGQRFRVGMDMRVHALNEASRSNDDGGAAVANESANGVLTRAKLRSE